MDWLCPSFNSALHKQLATYYGKLTPQVAIQYVMPIVQTGNLHVYVVNYSLFIHFYITITINIAVLYCYLFLFYIVSQLLLG